MIVFVTSGGLSMVDVTDLPDAVRSFYEYHAFLTEPWDGPAAIAASDGRRVIAAMDRNGLRPARWAITEDIVIVASEAGDTRI